MTYDSNNNPAPGNKLRQFPGQVSTNMWPRLQTMIGADHQFNASAATNDGWHKVIHMIAQSTPTAVPLTPQMYSKTLPSANTYPLVKYPDASAGAAPEMLLPPIIACGGFAGRNTAGNCTAVGITYNCTCARTTNLGEYIVTLTNAPPNADYIPLVSYYYLGLGVPITYRITDKVNNSLTIQFSFVVIPVIQVDPLELYVQIIYMPGSP